MLSAGDRRRLDRQQLGPPWWHRLPNFVPLAALKDGINPRHVRFSSHSTFLIEIINRSVHFPRSRVPKVGCESLHLVRANSNDLYYLIW